MTILAQHASTRQVDPNPPRFEIIESDKDSEPSSTPSEEPESEESPPTKELHWAEEVMPTTSQPIIIDSSTTAPTVPTMTTNKEFLKELNETLNQSVNAAFEKDHKSNLSTLRLLLEALE